MRKYCAEIVKWAEDPTNTWEGFACSIGVSYETIKEWTKAHPEFSAARKTAKKNQERLLMRVGFKGMNGQTKGFGQAAWIFWMKARFAWREDGPMDEDEEPSLEFDIS